MNNYTVLLLRPDYLAGEFGKDTHLTHVEADGPEQAVEVAQTEARDADLNDSTPPDDVDPTDYHPLFCCLGHQEHLLP